MVLFTILEIFNLAILTAAIGYIFSGFIKDPLHKSLKKLNWQDFRFALLVSAPGVLLHELAHKFVAMMQGLTANFFVWWPGLGIAVFLKLISSPFIIIAPGYVGIQGTATKLQTVLTSFSGPLINLILFTIAALILNNSRDLSRRQAIFLYLTKRINLFLFIFNMIPIPPLDGYNVVLGLFNIISSSS